MVKKTHEIRKASKKLKLRLDVALADIEQIRANLDKGKDRLPEELKEFPPLDILASKFRTTLLPNLQKESGEALYAGEQVMLRMDNSSEKLKKSLTILKFTYDEGNPIIEEYFLTPTWWGFGRTPDPRIRTHKRLNESFERHKDDIPEPLDQHFDNARISGEELEETWHNFLKEEREASRVIEDCINTLAEYKKLRRRIRNKLKGEFDDPQEAYKYVPKQKRKKKSS